MYSCFLYTPHWNLWKRSIWIIQGNTNARKGLIHGWCKKNERVLTKSLQNQHIGFSFALLWPCIWFCMDFMGNFRCHTFLWHHSSSFPVLSNHFSCVILIFANVGKFPCIFHAFSLNLFLEKDQILWNNVRQCFRESVLQGYIFFMQMS